MYALNFYTDLYGDVLPLLDAADAAQAVSSPVDRDMTALI